MIRECANSTCNKQFRYLHEGKLFRLPIDPRSSEQRWLWVCNDCLSRSFVLRHSAMSAEKPSPPRAAAA